MATKTTTAINPIRTAAYVIVLAGVSSGMNHWLAVPLPTGMFVSYMTSASMKLLFTNMFTHMAQYRFNQTAFNDFDFTHALALIDRSVSLSAFAVCCSSSPLRIIGHMRFESELLELLIYSVC
jgi:hypothetical protein